jgi:RimJ/RimL family protein N-acetyltransferase
VYGEALFLQILQRTAVRRALVKSFDALLLSSAIAHQRAVKSLGLLVRDYVPRQLPDLAQIRFEARRAEISDIPAILAVDQQVFRDPERLSHVISERHLVLFERDAALVGFGIIRPVIAGRPEVDLGIAVDAPYRNKGYAVFIFRDMVEYCFRHGLRPIAGCSEQNLASRRMGERVGMVARHRLLELTFEAPSVL